MSAGRGVAGQQLGGATTAYPTAIGPGKSFTQVYSTPNPPSANVSNNSPFETTNCGYTSDVGWTAPTNQLVVISSSYESPGTITGLLNKPFSFATSSDWQSFVPAPPELLDTIFQATLDKSLYGQFTSRRIWKGTSALKMSVELYFYAVNGAYNEVLVPCIRLQRLALPTYKSGTSSNQSILLTPPGPDPFSFTSANPGGDLISITVGGLLSFTPIIVRETTIQFDQKYDSQGYPMSAIATINFETYQLLTKEDISGMITPVLPGAGNGTAPSNAARFTAPTTSQINGATFSQ